MPNSRPTEAHGCLQASLASVSSLATEGSSASMISEKYRGQAHAYGPRPVPRSGQRSVLLSKSLAFAVIAICLVLLSYSLYVKIFVSRPSSPLSNVSPDESPARPVRDPNWLTPRTIPSALIEAEADAPDPTPSDTAPMPDSAQGPHAEATTPRPSAERPPVEDVSRTFHGTEADGLAIPGTRLVARPLGLRNTETELNRLLDVGLRQARSLRRRFTESRLRQHLSSNRQLAMIWVPVCWRYPRLDRKFEQVGERFVDALDRFYRKMEGDVYALQEMRRDKGKATPELLDQLRKMIPRYAWYERFLQTRPRYVLWKRSLPRPEAQSDSGPDPRYTLQLLEFPGKYLFAIRD